MAIFVVPELPPPPTISKTPDYPVYVPGESVTITCTSSRRDTAGRFQLRKDSNLLTNSTGSDTTFNHRITDLRADVANTYTCVMLVQVSARWLPSAPSRAIHIRVIELPRPPTISKIPDYPVYVPGESVTLTCASPRRETAGRFQLRKDSDLLTSSTGSDTTYTHRVPELRADMDSTYTCVMLVHVSARWLPSPPSPAVHIRVTERPRPPTISKTPDYPVYVPGESIILTCASPRRDTAGRFQLRKYSNLLTNSTGSHTTFTHRITELRADMDSTYTCIMLVHVSARWLPSPPSPAVHIRVTERPRPPTISKTLDYRVYVPGESVTITCASPRRDTAGRFQLRKGSDLLTSSTGNHTTFTHRVIDVRSDTDNTYTCVMLVHVSARWLPSPPSPAIHIRVTELPQPPTIAKTPDYPVYVPGESVNITCASSQRDTAGRFQLRKDSNLLTSSTGSRTTFIHRISDLRADVDNNYTCVMLVHAYARWLSSPPSPEIHIHVTDPPSRPIISKSPDHLVYFPGEIITMTCRVGRLGEAGLFLLMKDSMPLTNSTEVQSHFTYHMVEINRSTVGNYACFFLTQVNGRWIRSPVGQPLRIIVTELSNPLFSVDSPDVEVGGSITFECACSEVHTETTAVLQRSGEDVSDGWEVLGKGGSLTFKMDNVTLSDGGEYSCVCRLVVNGKVLTSAARARKRVTVKDNVWIKIMTQYSPVIAVGILLLFTAAVIPIAIIIKRKKGNEVHFYDLNATNTPCSAETTL
ncbi:immunoglobulin superfamily member 1-like isoform X2 [Leucoraja erinacea]|uniref:immunoglobulin superfamily member 1-like isoform X2 n=1 Tax=Leucoraja erinaceus TaxID=7782 RepID=UPI0024557AA6|nr:immunoglobulin superfamily member 1-like isoform X2 [Leucoraja erinacea]